MAFASTPTRLGADERPLNTQTVRTLKSQPARRKYGAAGIRAVVLLRREALTAVGRSPEAPTGTGEVRTMAALPFERSEYQDRVARVRRSMEKAGIDLLLSSDPANMNYLTGYDGWSFYVPQLVVVPPDGEDPLWIGRPMDAAGGKLTAWMAPERILGYPEPLVQARGAHPMDWVASYLVERGWGGKRIGVETDSYYFSPKALDHLKAGLPNAKFVDGDLVVNWVRAVKSPAEIGYLRQAARHVGMVMQTAYDAIRPGVRQCDAIAADLRGADGRRSLRRRRHHRALPADHVGRGGVGRASDVDRPDIRARPDQRARARRGAQALQCRPRPHPPYRQAAAAPRRHGEGGERGAGGGARRRSAPASPAPMSRRPGGACSTATASRRNRGSAIRSASAIRRIGASTRSACAPATPRCSKPTTRSTSCSACGWTAGAWSSARRCW